MITELGRKGVDELGKKVEKIDKRVQAEDGSDAGSARTRNTEPRTGHPQTAVPVASALTATPPVAPATGLKRGKVGTCRLSEPARYGAELISAPTPVAPRAGAALRPIRQPRPGGLRHRPPQEDRPPGPTPQHRPAWAGPGPGRLHQIRLPPDCVGQRCRHRPRPSRKQFRRPETAVATTARTKGNRLRLVIPTP